MQKWQTRVLWALAALFIYLILIQVIQLLHCLRVILFFGSNSSSLLLTSLIELHASRTAQSSSQSTFIMPRIIHQIWIIKNLSTYPLHPNSHNFWMKKYPNWEMKLWTDTDLDMLIWKDYRWLYPTYISYPYNVQRADIARLVVLHKFGGVYVDLDVFPKEKRDSLPLELLTNFRCVFPQASDQRTLTNHFIFCEAGSIVLAELLHRAPTFISSLWIPYLHVFASTGPLFVTQSLMEHDSLSSTYTSHTPDKVRSLTLLGPALQNRFFLHQGGRSWLTFDGKLFNYLADIYYYYHNRRYRWVFLFLLFTIFCVFGIYLSRRTNRKFKKPVSVQSSLDVP